MYKGDHTSTLRYEGVARSTFADGSLFAACSISASKPKELQPEQKINVTAGSRFRMGLNQVTGRFSSQVRVPAGRFSRPGRVSAGRFSSPGRVSGSKTRERSGLRQLGSEAAGALVAIRVLPHRLQLTQCRMDASPISGSSVLRKCKK